MSAIYPQDSCQYFLQFIHRIRVSIFNHKVHILTGSQDAYNYIQILEEYFVSMVNC